MKQEILQAVGSLGIALGDAEAELLIRFTEVFLDTNRNLNLTSVTEPEEVAVKHIADSLSLLKTDIPHGCRLADVGTGGGLPGIPIAIARPDVKVTLIDSTAKKLKFLDDVVSRLELTNCETLLGRAEELGNLPQYRETFDYAVWRGLGELRVSAELCLPLVKPGGRGIAMKGPKLDEEIIAARAIIGQIGGKIGNIVPVEIPGLNHKLLILEKIRPTPPTFPRPFGKIKQK